MLKSKKLASGYRLLAGLLLILTLSGCSFLSSFYEPETPEVKVVDQRLVALNLEEARLEVDIEVFNPNQFSLPVGALDYSLTVQGHSLAQGEQNQGFSLGSKKTETLTFVVDVNLPAAVATLADLKNSNRLDYQLSGGLVVDLPLLPGKRLAWETSGQLPLPQRPEIRLADLKVDHLTFTAARLVATLEITNPNIFSVDIERLNAGLELSGTNILDTRLNPGSSFPSQSSRQLQIPLDISFSSLGRSGYSALVDRTAINYRLFFDGLISSSDLPLQEIDYSDEVQGEIGIN
ncbi:LEA type 2 family protein [Marinospirillum perlucidum]|uniref:LEA type 2 family protein n=1 Tax=Marinospirillum perlucidum TaxID=1982602 RepID=UPI000DF399F3|nr:LEA type 2 family protein [Marinospirillum perlucidum]